jgi:hypothetical protein
MKEDAEVVRKTDFSCRPCRPVRTRFDASSKNDAAEVFDDALDIVGVLSKRDPLMVERITALGAAIAG